MKFVIALFLAAGMLAVVQAQQGGRGFGGFGQSGVAQIILVKDLQVDLKMSEEQITKVKDWAKDFGEKAKEIRKDKGVETPNFKGGGKGKGGGGGFTPPTTEQLEKMAAANAEINKLAYKELGDILSKEQITRLKEIDRQNRGVEAFTDADVVEALKLTDSQKTSLKTLNTDLGKESREIMAEMRKGGFDAEAMKEATAKVQKVRKEYIGKSVDVLTDEQKKTWKSLIGETFDVSKLAPQPMRRKD